MFLNNKSYKQKSYNISFFEYLAQFGLELAKTIIISLIIIVPVRFYIFQPFYVSGASMEPNFYDKEYLIVDEISYQFHGPERGDIVIFRYPRNPSKFFIKRVIGLPGETIVLHGGGITIINADYPQGFALDETGYLSEKIETRGELRVKLKGDEYYVMGDNRMASMDSRIFGPISKSAIIGRTWLRGWPLNRVTIFSTHGKQRML